MSLVKLSGVIVVAALLAVPSIALAAEFQVDVKIQSEQYIPEILQYWDDETGVPPWITENEGEMNEDYESFLGDWDEIGQGLSQDGTTITFTQTRNVCAQDVLDNIENEVVSRIAAVAADNYLESARVSKMVLTATSGNFSYVTSAATDISLSAFAGVPPYAFAGTLNDTKTVITLTPTGVAPDLALLFTSDSDLAACASNAVTVSGTVPTVEVIFDVVITLDVKTDINSEPPTQEEIAEEIIENFDDADEDGTGGLDYDEVRFVRPNMTEEEFVALDSDGDGQLTLDELNDAAEDRCGCSCRPDEKSLQDILGDWLLIGLSMIVLLGYAGMQKIK